MSFLSCFSHAVRILMKGRSSKKFPLESSSFRKMWPKPWLLLSQTYHKQGPSWKLVANQQGEYFECGDIVRDILSDMYYVYFDSQLWSWDSLFLYLSKQRLLREQWPRRSSQVSLAGWGKKPVSLAKRRISIFYHGLQATWICMAHIQPLWNTVNASYSSVTAFSQNPLTS